MKALLLLVLMASLAEAKPKNVAIVIYDGAELLDFAGPTEVLSAASGFARSGGEKAMHVYLVARTLKPVRMQGFVDVTPQFSIDNAPVPDLVVIPGGGSEGLEDLAMMTWLLKVTSASQTTLTVCTGAFPLAKAGAFDGLEITTFYGAVENLRSIAPRAKVTHGRRFVDNGKYITTAGVSAGIDGALHLTARLFGRRVADQTARYMEYHWTPEPYLAKDYAYWNPSLDDRGRQVQMADALVEEKRFKESAAVFEKLAATDTDGSTWVGLGNARYHLKDYRAAIAAYGKVSSKSPSYRTAIYNAACSYALAGDKAKALVAIKQALAAGIHKGQAMADSDLVSIRAELATM